MKIMILGASYSQLPLYEAAKRRGLVTVAASTPGPFPGFEAADETAVADLSDPDAVVEAARKHGVGAVASCGLDLAMRPYGAVAEALSIPGPSRKAAETVSDKGLMKAAMAKAGVRTAAFFEAQSYDELKRIAPSFKYPAVIKAVDQMGSRGVYRCGSAGEAIRLYPHVREVSRQDRCILEEFVDGELFGAEAMVQGGKLVFAMPNNTESVEVRGIRTPVGHSFPLRDADIVSRELEMAITGAVRAAGLDNCPVNMDLMRKGSEVYVIEFTGRPGATGLSELAGAMLGVNYYDLLISLALGEDVSEMIRDAAGERAEACLSHTVMAGASGRVGSLEVGSCDPSVDLSFNIAPGDMVRTYTNGRDRIGQAVIAGSSLAECEGKLRTCLGGTKIILEDGTLCPCL